MDTSFRDGFQSVFGDEIVIMSNSVGIKDDKNYEAAKEIEAAFNTLPYVNEAGVVYKKFGDGLGQIIAFLNINLKKEKNEILENISNIIPAYMIPKSIHILYTLPKNKNGKIDRIELAKISNT